MSGLRVRRSAWGVLLLFGAASCATAGGARGGAETEAADQFARRIAPFAVAAAGGEPHEHPFLGGFDVPRPQFVDIDDDGDLDLFIQERSNELIFLENTGTPSAPRFTWRTDKFHGLDIGEWSRFVDLDGDGDPDLLAEAPYSYIRYYRNVGAPGRPEFELAADTLRDPAGEPVFADRQNIPSIVDIDCDGLLDLFLGRVSGTITRHEQVESSGGAPPSFRFVEDRWQGIEIIGQIGETPPGDVSEVPPNRPTMHGANAMAFADVDGDGDLDLLWGDFFEPSVLLIENTGSCANPSFRSEPVPLPTAEPLLSSGYNVPVPVDIDADGDLDLFVGVLGGAFNPNRTAADNLWFLEQVEGEGLVLRSRRYLDAVDVGSESVPALGDLDGDGDLDLLVGNKLDPVALRSSRVYRYENVGGPGSPAFRLADTLELGSSYHYAPALGDLDGDGDLDLVVGTWNDEVQVYWNQDGGRFQPAGEPEVLVELTRGSNSTPALGDVDGDGDLDLVVGESSGTLNFYRNEGSPSRPRFVLVSDRFLDLDVGRRSHPALVDLDGDGDPELVVGREEAGALLLRNVSQGAEVAFQRQGPVLPLPPYAAPAFGDLEGGVGGGLIFVQGQRR